MLFRLILLLFVCEIRAANILVLFPHVGRSHHLTFEPLFKKLAGNGHKVTVVSFFPPKETKDNYTHVSLESLATIRKEAVNLSYLENQNKIADNLGLRMMLTQIIAFEPLTNMALGLCPKLVNFEPLAEVLKKKYDVVLVENFNSDCFLGLLHVYGVKAPVITMSSCPMMPWSASRIGVSDNPSYVPVISSEMTSKMSFLQRMENTVMNVYLKLWFRYSIQVKEREIIEKHFETKIPDLEDLARNMTLMLINTFHSLNGARPMLPGVVEVGGLHLYDRVMEPIPQYIERFLNESDHGVVLFSWGSLIKTATIPKYKEEIIVNALSKIKQRVIWKYEDSDEEGTLTGNILKVKWIPQYELLQHKKVIAFIGHGGLLGMTEAISAGKPMLIVPFYGDQPMNGAAAEAIGLGKSISYADMSEKSLLEGLQTVLSAEMRLSARRASKIWQDRIADPMETAVYWVERITRWGDLDPLHSTSRDLTFIQYNLLDVLAVITITLTLFIILLWIVLTKILRLISSSFHSKEKLQ